MWDMTGHRDADVKFIVMGGRRHGAPERGRERGRGGLRDGWTHGWTEERRERREMNEGGRQRERQKDRKRMAKKVCSRNVRKKGQETLLGGKEGETVLRKKGSN